MSSKVVQLASFSFNLVQPSSCSTGELALSIKAQLTILDYHKAWNTMTEETETREPASPEKLIIDNPSDFQFHAAYLTYSNTYDKTASIEARKLLNQSIMALKQNEIDYSTFYRNIDQYRTEEGSQRGYGRTLIKTQKKREWRRKTQKHERIERHRR